MSRLGWLAGLLAGGEMLFLWLNLGGGTNLRARLLILGFMGLHGYLVWLLARRGLALVALLFCLAFAVLYYYLLVGTNRGKVGG